MFRQFSTYDQTTLLSDRTNDVYKSLDGRYAKIGPVRRSDLLEE